MTMPTSAAIVTTEKIFIQVNISKSFNTAMPTLLGDRLSMADHLMLRDLASPIWYPTSAMAAKTGPNTRPARVARAGVKRDVGRDETARLSTPGLCRRQEHHQRAIPADSLRSRAGIAGVRPKAGLAHRTADRVRCPQREDRASARSRAITRARHIRRSRSASRLPCAELPHPVAVVDVRASAFRETLCRRSRPWHSSPLGGESVVFDAVGDSERGLQGCQPVRGWRAITMRPWRRTARRARRAPPAVAEQLRHAVLRQRARRQGLGCRPRYNRPPSPVGHP